MILVPIFLTVAAQYFLLRNRQRSKGWVLPKGMMTSELFLLYVYSISLYCLKIMSDIRIWCNENRKIYDWILCILIVISYTHSSINYGLMFYLSLSKRSHFDALRYNCLFINFQYSFISFFLLLPRLK
jgi:hypothetical protein